MMIGDRETDLEDEDWRQGDNNLDTDNDDWRPTWRQTQTLQRMMIYNDGRQTWTQTMIDDWG